ncbi:hypothetical protein [Prolixibacter denitrificans]|uniref:Outer membrane protein with beta-barrel domain n=1 Tax=Prolixibacter denitrificans TaxID=1541063 RepID=A0A2P8C6L1_9BACT|nr:hypothetical protein [Prolixibacter denitrificans]PSK80613.1 hypothetical protein CLV93_11450 [Prolixibacter denitrificans]GET22093.1 hypothetical protein JCM18694_23390 [Prolixibacter denitrificans]
MMKRTLIKGLFICSIHSANAQFANNNAIYSTSGLSFGNYMGGDVSLNYVYREKYSCRVGYSDYLRKPKSQPADYSSGLAKAIIFGLENPHDQIENYQIAVGRICKLNETGTIRANLSIGVGYTIIKEPENWQKVEGTSLVAENYTWDYHRQNTVSLIINPQIEFPFTNIYGLTISPMLQLNKDRTYVGIGIGQMIGILRKRTE